MGIEEHCKKPTLSVAQKSAVLHAKLKKGPAVGTTIDLDLNTVVGNNNGLFLVPGVNFSHSASNVRLEGWVLHAELEKANGDLINDEVNLKKLLTLTDGRLALLTQKAVEGDRNKRWNTRTAHQSHGVCDICRDFPSEQGLRMVKGKMVVFSASIREIKHSRSQTGCSVCILIWKIAQRLAQGDPKYLDPDTICVGDRMRNALDSPFMLRFELATEYNVGEKSKETEYWLYREEGSPDQSATFNKLPSASHVEINPSMEDGVAFVRSWMKDCLRNHSKCVSAKSKSAPTRLLSIGTGPEDAVKVFETRGRSYEYACLSYVIGVDLKKYDLHQYQHEGKSVNVQNIPKTYQDVIAFCRRLAIEYLWIDSLCILQNNEGDWLRESVKMADYYGNCCVCIAASSSQSLEGGCTAQTSPTKFHGKGRDENPYEVFLRPNIHHIHSDEDFPLLHRAWCYQERRLAPRVVHFCGYELFLECNQMSVCQCGGEIRQKKPLQHLWTKDQERFYLGQHDISQLTDVGEKAIQEWYAHVHNFSGLDLTNIGDKLVALSGIAKRIEERRSQTGQTPGRYLAGLWENTLIDDLSWCVGKNLSTFRQVGRTTALGVQAGPASHPRPEPGTSFLAPSWSWASVRDQVQHNGRFSKHLCNVVSVETHLADSQALLGPVRGGHLTLQAQYLLPVCTRWINTGNLPNYWGLVNLPGRNGRKCLKWYPDYDISNQLEVQDHLGSAHPPRTLSEVIGKGLRGNATARAKEMQLYLMPLASRQTENTLRSLFSHETLTVSILLKQLSKPKGDPAPKFERIGWTYYSGKHVDKVHQSQSLRNVAVTIL